MKIFQEVSDEISSLAKAWEPKLLTLSEETISTRKNTQGRTIRQITGHLVDSASNNTHRVVHLQYQSSPLIFPDYANLGNNDKWISVQNYQEEEWNDLVKLFKYSMLHFAHVIRNVNSEKLGNIWITALNKPVNEMVADFPRHFKLHLDEIEDLLIK